MKRSKYYRPKGCLYDLTYDGMYKKYRFKDEMKRILKRQRRAYEKREVEREIKIAI